MSRHRDPQLLGDHKSQPTKVRAGYQANKRCLCNAGLMLRHRRRRCPNIKTTLGLSAMFKPSRSMHSKYMHASNLSNAVLILGQRLQRWTNIKSALSV